APELKVLVLFNQLDACNKEIYDALAESLGYRAEIDFHIYHDSAAHLKYLLRKKQTGCSYIIIIPNFLDDPETGYHCISRIPDEKLIILHSTVPGHTGNFGVVGENLVQAIPNALTE